jgi:hypothetical protein
VSGVGTIDTHILCRTWRGGDLRISRSARIIERQVGFGTNLPPDEEIEGDDLPEGARFVPKPNRKFEIAVTFRELLAA